MGKAIVLKANNLIEKRNILNEMKTSCFTLQEARIFALYLSRINPRNLKTRLVKFKLDEFLSIIKISKVNISKMMDTTNKLLSIVLNVPDDDGGYTAFQLFKKCRVFKDKEENEWYFEIDAHDEALPLMFEFQNQYFTYKVGNVLRLGSSNQMRMYEILKQYEKIGTRTIAVDKLKELIGIEKKEYPRYGDFKRWVIEPCQKALSKNTDIKFTYEPCGKRGQGGKVIFLKFTITKNTDYADQLTLSNFIDIEEMEEPEEKSRYQQRTEFFIEACDSEFSFSEIEVLVDLMREKFSGTECSDDLWCYDYLMRKYREMSMRNEKKKITHRFAYMKSLIGTE